MMYLTAFKTYFMPFVSACQFFFCCINDFITCGTIRRWNCRFWSTHLDSSKLYPRLSEIKFGTTCFHLAFASLQDCLPWCAPNAGAAFYAQVFKCQVLSRSSVMITVFENNSKCRILNFWILAFSINFCPIKIDLSGNTVWPQASGF